MTAPLVEFRRMVATNITEFWDTRFASSEVPADVFDGNENDVFERCIAFFW